MEEIKEETYIPAEKSDHPIRRRVFLGMLACLAVIILGVVWFVADTLADAPPLDADDIAPDGYRTTVLDRNGEEMVTLMGGKRKVIADLDSMFQNTPKQMLWNAYYNHANEPVHFVPYLYNRLGQPWKTQYHTRYICRNAYHNKVEGLVGNEDVGQM